MAGQNALRLPSSPATGSPVVTAESPVMLLARQLAAVDPGFAALGFEHAEPEAPWFAPHEVLPAMLASGASHTQAGPAVLGARLAGSLGHAAAGRLAVAMAVVGRAYDVGPDSLMLRLNEDGLVGQIAVRSPRIAVLPDDPLAGRFSTTVVKDHAELASWAASRACSTLTPLVDQVHAHTRYGTVAMWNQIADSVLGPTTRAPLLTGQSQEAGRAMGQLLLDALVAQGAPIRRRGTVRPAVDETGRQVLDPVRGMCCLVYRQDREKCGSCPLVR